MQIEKIKKQGKTYKITLNNGEVITTYDNVIIQNGLLYHKKINEKILNKINTDTKYYETYNKVLDMLSKKQRSENEIKIFLDGKIENPEEIIDNFKQIGLINDEKYAKAYTNDKINFTKDGPNKIRKDLEENKINEKYIQNAIESIDENILKERIDKIINKKISTNTKDTAIILKQKIYMYLINLGYDSSMIKEILENYQINNQNLEKQMQKEYEKLSKKYQNNELKFKLKNKLYAKGYTIEEINEFIEKNLD